ncbi:MAG: hypothetical protein PVG21_07215, partial [Gammaproteobacteria bacterium]
MRKIVIAAAFIALSPAAFAADNIDNLGALAQAEFRGLSEDLGASLSYKALEPAEPAGLLGFDLGVDASATKVQNPDAWRLATSGSSVDYLPMARVRFTKGLPLGFDVGGFYTTVPGSNIKSWGAELRYALVEGGALTPAVGLRGGYTKLTGVNQLAFDTRSVDLSISKGFGPITPYAGVGRVWTDSNPDASTGLSEETFNQNKYFGGLRLSLVAINFVVEADRTGQATTYSLKFG